MYFIYTGFAHDVFCLKSIHIATSKYIGKRHIQENERLDREKICSVYVGGRKKLVIVHTMPVITQPAKKLSFQIYVVCIYLSTCLRLYQGVEAFCVEL